MRKAAKQIILCAAGLFVLCILCRFAFFNRFSLYITLTGPGPETAGEIRVEVEDPGVLQAGEAELHSGYVRIPVRGQSPGRSDLILRIGEGEEQISWYHVVRVDRLGTVYDTNTGNFTGDTALLAAVALFWLLVSAIMLWHFFRARGTALYDYGTIYYAGFSLFALASGLTLLGTLAARIFRPETFIMYNAYSAINSAGTRYMILTMPLMIFFAAALAVSNLVLLRHERPGLQNVTGLAVSVLLIAGEIIGVLIFFRDFSGSEWEGRIDNALQNTYGTAFIYCQCMLTGSVICGIRAARHRPAPDKDFIIILGCWFRKDGTLPPLLRGRADRALEFWEAQKAETGKEAVFIPSGGQGADEPMPEGEAVRQYLLSRGVSDRLILPETRSVNTFENMDFSRQIIRGTGREGKAVFSTSSYHVFRSGLWARQAGLAAEGIGSRTKWWFWPNAFLRETAGLLRKRWKQEILFLVLLVAFFVAMSLLL